MNKQLGTELPKETNFYLSVSSKYSIKTLNLVYHFYSVSLVKLVTFDPPAL